MQYRATNPKRVLDKFRECQHFLVAMADHEKAMETEKFLFSLSAFLSAFRSTAYRLIGIVRGRDGSSAGRGLRAQLFSHADIGFLKDATDLEVHGDGVVVWQRYTVSMSDSMHGRWGPRFARNSDRWPSRSESRYAQARALPYGVDWQFDKRPENLIAVCHGALDGMEKFIRLALTTSPTTVQVRESP